MKRSHRLDRRRRGFSLLEMMTAAAITATLMASSMVVIRSSYTSWQAHEGDMQKAAAADAVVRHIVRNLRQAVAVYSITGASDTTGRLELTNSSGSTVYWEHTGTSDGIVVYNGSGVLLAEGIDELIFTGYEADGTTVTTVPQDVHLIKATVRVTLPRGAGQTRTVSCCGWVRSW